MEYKELILVACSDYSYFIKIKDIFCRIGERGRFSMDYCRLYITTKDNRLVEIVVDYDAGTELEKYSKVFFVCDKISVQVGDFVKYVENRVSCNDGVSVIADVGAALCEYGHISPSTPNSYYTFYMKRIHEPDGYVDIILGEQVQYEDIVANDINLLIGDVL